MIDPLQSLEFSVQSNPGVYALLLGSGVSRAAGIPTGWEIVLDLLGKLAATTEATPVSDAGRWYLERYQETPDYSQLLDALAKTPSERQQLLRPYFEPDEQEREEGLKQPTVAHRTIARLVAQGFVKVIITTNFDRLLETALDDEGVAPIVLSTLEDVKGARPLVHIPCCVFKIHGDYRDPGILNTESELADYPPEFNQFLDRIFDEYGLIVCGWSAEWDTALRKALSRSKARRFSTYWAARGELSDPAQRLISQRDAQVIPIEGADSFFQSLQEGVESIEEYSKPHPLSTESAIVTLKRYLSSEEYRIRLSDHVAAVVEQAIQGTTGKGFELGDPEPDLTSITARLRRYESACATLVHMAAVGGYWADEGNVAVWERVAERLSATRVATGTPYYSMWAGLTMYPATLYVYAFGLGALLSRNLNLISRVFGAETTYLDVSGRKSQVSVLQKLFKGREDCGGFKGLLEGMGNRPFAINDWLHNALRPPLRSLVPEDDEYSYAFDKFEAIAALAYGRTRIPTFGDWFPIGSFVSRRENWIRALGEIEESIRNDDSSDFLRSGILGDSPEDCLGLIERFRIFTPELAQRLGFYTWY